MDNSSSSATFTSESKETVLTPAAAVSAPSTTTLEDLPFELVLKIGKRLSLKDKANLASTSKKYYGIFQSELGAARLLLFVARGQQDEAHSMLGQFPKLLLKCGDVTDYSGRTFNKITAYEYAYWAKDTHMCRMLETHMVNATKDFMLKRIDVMERDGLTYEQHGVVITHSKHFDFTPLKTALRRYVDGYDNWFATSNWAAMKAAWMEVGIAQRDMPVHVVNEYCHPDRSFYPRPEFNEEALPRSLRFYNDNTNSEQALFPLDVSDTVGLGIDWAVARGEAVRAGHCVLAPAAPWYMAHSAPADLAAVSRLDEVRTVDLTQSRENRLPADHGPGLGVRV